MRLNISTWFNKKRGKWRQWTGWLVLICYVAILYIIASYYFHVREVFLFVAIFMALSFAITIAFKFLEEADK